MGKRFRQLVFWIHLPIGVVAGLIVLVMSATGVLLAYERQITAWADSGYRATPPSPSAARLPMTELLAKVRETQPEGRPATITLRSDAVAPLAIGYGRERTLFVDPYTGTVLGEGSRGVRAFFQSVTGWHRWLALDGDSRALGRGLTGAANLGFLFLVVSGVYLWWPRSWSGQALGTVTLFQRQLSGRARDFNWHNVFGFWAALPLAFIVASGVVMSYPWANDLLYRLTGNEPPPRRTAEAGPEGRREAPGERRGEGRRGDGEGRRDAGERRERGAAPLDLGALDRAWAAAEKQVPGWRSITLRVPQSDAPLTFTIDTSDGGRAERRSQLTLDRKSGELVRFESFEGQNLGRRLRSWARFVHTGEALGVWGQTIAGLASGAGVMLVWTGLALGLRRFAAWRRRRASRAADLPAGAAAAFLTASKTDEPA